MVENEHLSWDSWINKKYIVIHHTATRSDLTASQMLLSMKRTWIDNRKMSRIPTTFIVDSKWNYIQVNKIDEDVWACIKDRYNTTWQVIECNQYWIHIELVWDFNKSKPTEKQYEWLSRLIMYLQNKNKNLIVKYHSDFQTKNCPWKRFDKFKILNMIWLTDWEYKYSLSRYYSNTGKVCSSKTASLFLIAAGFSSSRWTSLDPQESHTFSLFGGLVSKL